MNSQLTHKAFTTALMLFGFPKKNVYNSMMTKHTEEIKALYAAGYLTDGPITTMVLDRESDDPSDWRDAEWNPETRTYQYTCLTDTGIWVVDVPDEEMKTYNINLDWMAKHIRDLVEIESTAQVRVIIPDCLWELGYIRAGHQRAAIFLAKDLAREDVFESVYDAFLDWTGKSPGLVLSNKVPGKRHAELPGGHRILDLDRLVMETGSGYALDLELLHGTLKSASPYADHGPVQPSSDYSSIRVHGRVFVFTGRKQREIVEKLYRAWRLGNSKCRTKEVLESIDSAATSLSHLFSNHPDWKELIEYSGGFCWLKV
ncbi:MAG: hypothetical protein HQM06_16870 [Magnetococcales bacterium]|nr:hypothetical protein [Magnetococcales bacterium]